MTAAREERESLDPRINAALQDYLERRDRGESIRAEDFLAEHAEIADGLRSFLAASEDLDRRATAEVSTNGSLSETVAPLNTGGATALPETFGRYRVQRLLGRGAMGVVYLAQDTQLTRQVALKIPSFGEGQTSELLERFYREARAAATLRNPNICPVYDVGEIDGQHYISMAYIEGRPLSDIIRSSGAQSERQSLLLVRKLALALQEAHQQGIVHRDLKPGNIMIDVRGEPVVMDFGLACQIQEGAARLTHSGVILGSPAYMAPEQLEGSSGKVSPAADQYAMGVILYELLTGELPFRGSVSAVISQIVTKPAPSPRKLRPDLDPRVDALCLQLMAKSAAERLPSMKALAERIVAILKEPAPAPAAPEAATETAPPAAGIQKQVAGLLQRGELRAALETLEPLLQRKAGKLSDWARQQQAEIQSQLERWERESSALGVLAGKLIRKHDYVEAIQVLSAVPGGVRTEALQELLSDAEGKEEESALLLQDIEQAIRKEQVKELPALVKRFLQLKPGNKAVQALAAELQQFGPERVIRMRRGRRDFLDPAGQVWNPYLLAGFVAALLLTCGGIYLAAITFQTPHGTVIIEVHDPRVAVTFAGDEITATSSGKEYRLKTTDRKTLQLEIDGVTVDTSTQEITVSRNETKLITARLIDGQLDLKINSQQQTFAVPPKLADDSATAKAAWVDLMEGFDPPQNEASVRRWKRDGQGILCTLGDFVETGWVSFVPEREITGDYDLELNVRPIDCTYMQAGLPLNDTIVTASFGADGTGLHWIDGTDIDWNRADLPHGNKTARLLPGEINKITATVRHAGENVTIAVTLNGEPAASFSGLRSRLSVPKESFPAPGKLKVVGPLRRKAEQRGLEILTARVRHPVERTAAEATAWMPLWNGKDLKGWTVTGDSPEQVQAIDGVLTLSGTGKGWVATEQAFADFELELEYQLASGGNSGVFLRMPATGTINGMDFLEVQLLDSRGPPPAKPIEPWQQNGALYGVTPPDPVPPNAEDWSQLKVRSEGPVITVSMNGTTLSRTDLKSARVLRPQPIAELHRATGRIGLQRHGSKVEFRNIRIRNLDAKAAPVASTERLLDVDFRQTAGGFSIADQHHIRTERRGGEYYYVGKKTGQWFHYVHPDLALPRNRLQSGTALEMDVRLVGGQRGRLAIEFGKIGSERLFITLNEQGRVGVVSGKPERHVTLMEPFLPPRLSVVDQFNTLRLEMAEGELKVLVNGGQVYRASWPNYSATMIQPWIWADEVPFDVRWQRFRLEPLTVTPKQAQSQATTTIPAPPSKATAPDSTVILDVDFRKGPEGFSLGDEDHILADHKDGEYRYLGKKAGWWYGGLHPALWKVENNQLRDFAIELDVRLVGKKKGLFGIEFGRSGDQTLTLCLDQAGQLRLIRGAGEVLVAPATAPALRPVDQFNSVRLEVQNKTARVSVNGQLLFEKPLERYSGGPLCLWLAPEDVPFDTRLQRVKLERLSSDQPRPLTPEVRRLKGHPDIVRGVAFLPDNRHAVSVGHGQAFKLWDVQTGRQVHDFTGHPDHVTSVSVSGDGTRALTGCWDGNVRLWDLEKRTLLKTLKGHSNHVVSVLLSQNGQTGLSASTDGTIRRWDLKTGAKSKVLPGPAPDAVLAMNSDENIVAAGNADGSIVLRGPQGLAPLTGHRGGFVEGLAFTPDGTKLITGGDDGTVRVWEVASGKELHTFEGGGAGFDTIAVLDDGRHIIAGCEDHSIRVWDLETGDAIARIDAAQPVTHRLAVSPDHQFVLSAGGDRGWKGAGDYDLYLWRLPRPPAPPAARDLSGLQPVMDADFSRGLEGFGENEDDYFRVGLVKGEWQYLGKNAGWAGWGGPQSKLIEQPRHDFVFEAEMRWATPKGYAWGLEFGRLPDGRVQRFHASVDRQIWLAAGAAGDMWTETTPRDLTIRTMRPATEFNTFRLEVATGIARIFVNSHFVAEAPLPEYGMATTPLLLFPNENHSDLRFRRIRLWDLPRKSP